VALLALSPSGAPGHLEGAVSGADALLIRGGRALTGVVRVPGDKSISHRGLLIGALAEGDSSLQGISNGEDVKHTLACVRALGAEVHEDAGALGVTRVVGGDSRLKDPRAPLYAGNSGTTMRLLAGVLASKPWSVELTGDESLSARPMDRVALPLGLMGASVEGRGPRCLPPIRVTGPAPPQLLEGIEYTLPVPSAQVKSAILLAGLAADGETVVREPVRSRVHTEEVLAMAGADMSAGFEDGEWVVRLRPCALSAFQLEVAGDPSQAAFFVVGATLTEGSDVLVDHVYDGPARTGFVDVLFRMGADIEVAEIASYAGSGRVVSIRARHSRLQGTEVQASEMPGLDEVPVLSVAAALAEGTTVFRGVGELRVKESDRLAACRELALLLGASAEVRGDDLVIEGTRSPRPFALDAHGDHRMAMAAAVAGLGVRPALGPSRVVGWSSVRTSYPGFELELARLGAQAEEMQG
jgi:3-phosphoshikimate 1-carboxyvinyltransferase